MLIWLFIWYYKVSTLPKLYHRLSKRSGATVRKFRGLEDAGKKMVKRNLDVMFWQRCIDLEICPDFLKFRPPRIRQYKNVQQMYQHVVKESLYIAKSDFDFSQKRFFSMKDDVTANLSYVERTVLLSLLNKQFRTTASYILKTHNDKLTRLWKTQRPKCPSCIVNLSKKQLTLEEENVLYRGLNRHIMHKKVPIDTIKVAVEDCVNAAVLHEARTDLANIPASKTKCGERERKAALYDTVNDITKTKCDAAFRDKLKVAFNKFIAAAKSVCNVHINRTFHATVNRLARDDGIKICKYDKGVGLVVLDTYDYFDKLDVIINDTAKFQKVKIKENEKHPLTKKEDSIRDYLYRYFKKHVDLQTYKKTTTHW